MEAAEKGVLIQVDAIVDLTGTTVRNLRVEGPSDTGPRDLAMTIGSPSNIAERLTEETDFPVGGNYHIQLQTEYSDGRKLKSPPEILNVRDMM